MQTLIYSLAAFGAIALLCLIVFVLWLVLEDHWMRRDRRAAAWDDAVSGRINGETTISRQTPTPEPERSSAAPAPIHKDPAVTAPASFTVGKYRSNP